MMFDALVHGDGWEGSRVSNRSTNDELRTTSYELRTANCELRAQAGVGVAPVVGDLASCPRRHRDRRVLALQLDLGQHEAGVRCQELVHDPGPPLDDDLVPSL